MEGPEKKEDKTVGRLTQRNGNTVLYVGNRCKYPGIDQAGTMKVAAMRECMERLAEYEDTGLTPEQITKLLQEHLQKN